MCSTKVEEKKQKCFEVRERGCSQMLKLAAGQSWTQDDPSELHTMLGILLLRDLRIPVLLFVLLLGWVDFTTQKKANQQRPKKHHLLLHHTSFPTTPWLAPPASPAAALGRRGGQNGPGISAPAAPAAGRGGASWTSGIRGVGKCPWISCGSLGKSSRKVTQGYDTEKWWFFERVRHTKQNPQANPPSHQAKYPKPIKAQVLVDAMAP